MKKFLVLIMTFFTLATPLAFSRVVSAQFDPLEKPCTSIDSTDAAQEICDASKNPTDPINGDSGIIVRVANILSLVAAVIAVIVIIVSGITMMTSNGDAGKVAKSRSTIIYTVIGLVVIVMARTIVVFIFSKIV